MGNLKKRGKPLQFPVRCAHYWGIVAIVPRIYQGHLEKVNNSKLIYHDEEHSSITVKGCKIMSGR
jgi:hypothetical protein